MKYYIMFLALFLFITSSHTNSIPNAATQDKKMHYFYDENRVRYSLVKSSGGPSMNWVFLPGGPAADSRYLLTLISILNIPGNVWLIDLPGSGDNTAPENYDFNNWLTLIDSVAERFSNCVIVGHSLGGMLPLLEPKLESKIRGLVILNSAPSLWIDESNKTSEKLGIPLLPEKEAFGTNQSQENYNNLLKAYLPYFFREHSLKKGAALFENLPFPIGTALKVLQIMQDINYTAKWIPQKTPTLIIGGDKDYLNPFSLFEKDTRFNRKNIKKVLLKDCGHWSWIEQPDDIQVLFKEFVDDLQQNISH